MVNCFFLCENLSFLHTKPTHAHFYMIFSTQFIVFSYFKIPKTEKKQIIVQPHENDPIYLSVTCL